LARHERDFRASAGEPLSFEEALAMLGRGIDEADRARRHAIACYLSASEGWRDAVKQLGGAFADAAAELRERKSD